MDARGSSGRVSGGRKGPGPRRGEVDLDDRSGGHDRGHIRASASRRLRRSSRMAAHPVTTQTLRKAGRRPTAPGSAARPRSAAPGAVPAGAGPDGHPRPADFGDPETGRAYTTPACAAHGGHPLGSVTLCHEAWLALSDQARAQPPIWRGQTLGGDLGSGRENWAFGTAVALGAIGQPARLA